MNYDDAQPLREEVRRLRSELEVVRAENVILRQELDRLAGRIFGKKSEQLSADQLQLLFQELVAPGPAQGKPCGPEGSEAHPPRPQQAPERSRKERKPRIPGHLTVIEEIVDPEPVKACPEAWRQIGEEVAERLEYEPARVICRRTVRRKYVRRGTVDARACDCATATLYFGAQHCHATPCRTDPRGQVLRAPSAIPAGVHL